MPDKKTEWNISCSANSRPEKPEYPNIENETRQIRTRKIMKIPKPDKPEPKVETCGYPKDLYIFKYS